MSDIQHIEFIPLREVIWSPADKLLSYSMCDKRIPDCLDGANLQEWLPSETLPNLYEKSGLLEV